MKRLASSWVAFVLCTGCDGADAHSIPLMPNPQQKTRDNGGLRSRDAEPETSEEALTKPRIGLRQRIVDVLAEDSNGFAQYDDALLDGGADEASGIASSSSFSESTISKSEEGTKAKNKEDDPASLVEVGDCNAVRNVVFSGQDLRVFKNLGHYSNRDDRSSQDNNLSYASCCAACFADARCTAYSHTATPHGNSCRLKGRMYESTGDPLRLRVPPANVPPGWSFFSGIYSYIISSE
jgi:hypothetical protein